MVKNISGKDGCNFEWVDVYDPTEAELAEIAAKYQLHTSSVNDCLQVGHLPKYEQLKQYTFVIMRVYFPDTDLEADSVRELTNKIAIFVAPTYLITVHRKPWKQIEQIVEEHTASEACKTSIHLLGKIVMAGLRSFDEPGNKLTNALETYEKRIFLAERQLSILKGMYYTKRKMDVIRRLLLLTYEIVDFIDKQEVSNAFTRDIRDLYVKQKSLYDALSENLNHLLNIYFNVSSQRTNDTMRVLTIFSVFFMPLTFIVGIYGMNFKYMPELEWRSGYPAVLTLMAFITILIFAWFRKKRWL